MKISTGKIICGMFLGGVVLSAAVPAVAASKTLVCDGKRTISDELKKLKPGDTLVVNGACVENVVVPEDIQQITLDGQGTASIGALIADQATLQIQGRGITVTGLTISGGRNGVSVTRGGTALINGNVIQGAQIGVAIRMGSTAELVNNTIQDNSANGVTVAENAVAQFDNNLIQNNNIEGVIINENSSARFGFNAPNVIQSNGGRGIVVTRASNARIIRGNTIRNNLSRGVDVLRGSHADVADNHIDGNGGHGILVNYNSALNLDEPNTGSNLMYGILCINSGMVDGRRGELTGDSGQTFFANGCINNTRP